MAGGCHSDLTAGKAFTHIVVAVSGQIQMLRPFGMKAPKLWPPAPVQFRVMVSSGRPFLIAAGDLRTEDGTESTVRIGNFHFQRSFLAFFYGSFQLLPENLFILGLLQFKVINVFFR